jgi:hypothetical protein
MKKKAWGKGQSFFNSDQMAGSGSRTGAWSQRLTLLCSLLGFDPLQYPSWLRFTLYPSLF